MEMQDTFGAVEVRLISGSMNETSICNAKDATDICQATLQITALDLSNESD
jgi:hypothetical protein